MKNRDLAVHLGREDEYDTILAEAAAEFPNLSWGDADLTLYHGQILARTLPKTMTQDATKFAVALFGEPEACEAVHAGRFDEACAIPVTKETERVCLLPSVCFFMNGRIRRGAMLAAAYAMQSGIKMGQLAGANLRLSLASPVDEPDLTMAQAMEGLDLHMRMYVGNGAQMPSASDLGPVYTDEEVMRRIAKSDSGV